MEWVVEDGAATSASDAALATAHGAGREAGGEGQSRAREEGARGGGVSEEVEGQERRIRMEEHRRRSREGVAGE